IKNGFLVFSFYWQMVFVKNRRIELSRSLTHAYMGAPYTFHLTHNTSEIMSNIDREVTLIANQVITPILEIATRFLMLLGILVFLFAVEPLITLFWLLAFSLIGVLGIVALSTKLKLFGLEEQQNRRRFVKALYQGFGIIKEARILNRESFFSKQIVETVSRMAKTLAFKQFATKAVPPVTEFAALTSLLCLVVGLILLGRSTESILITLSLFIVGLIRMRETISAAMAHFATLRYSIVSIDPVYNDLKYLESRSKTSHLESAATPQPYHMHQQIELRDVSYRYDGAPHDALKDINLVIPAGSAVGFVGSTGAGKSTIVDTILGLLDPVKGGVFVDGRDIRERGIDSWQATIGYVPQSIYLLDDTIRRNIALGISDDEIDERAVWNALKAAQLENFVNHHPAGLDSVVGEQGVRLSGGERQRIGI
ncbi:MAG: ABC transporter ATP-binding protein, partial [Haliea sp.]